MNLKKSFAYSKSSELKLVDSINDANRNETWLEITGAYQLLTENSGYYEHLKSLPEPPNSKSIKQIDKDISRTFPGDFSFDKFKLRNILVAYSFRNPNVGYCQGLNFIVATLLGLKFDEEQTFWIYCQIIERYLPIEYYNSMSGVILDQKVFDYFFRAKLQKVSKALDKISIESCLFTVQWFICIYSFAFKREIVTFVWDQFFARGYSILFTVGLSMIWIFRKQIMVQNDFIQALELIETGCKAFTDLKLLKKTMKKRSFRVPPMLVQRLRALMEGDVINEFVTRFANVIPQQNLLNTLDITCLDDNECKQKILTTCKFFTFRSSYINEVDGYLDLCNYPKFADYNTCKNMNENYLLGKKNHCCRFEEEHEKNSQELICEIEEEEINEPIEFIRRHTMMASVKNSFAYISNCINMEEFE